LLDEPVLGSMHFDVIRKSLLGEVSGFSVLTDHVPDTLLQCGAAAFHCATLK